MSSIGILNVNKPAGCTSREVVDRVQRLVLPAKVGHAGTLDPLAAGVLVICVGSATRLVQYVQRMPKSYRATFLLGRSSPTDDTEGEITLRSDAPQPSVSEIELRLSQFVGQIEQRPPDHSAAKVAGRRAYKLARRGEPVGLAPKTVTIHRLALQRYEYPELGLEIECGSGTYVRALGRDLATSLGTAAVVSALVRTATGCFRVEHAVPLRDLSAETLPQHLQPALAAVADLPRVALCDEQIAEIRHGRPITKPQAATEPTSAAEWAAVDSSGRLVAILSEKVADQLWPFRNFLA